MTGWRPVLVLVTLTIFLGLTLTQSAYASTTNQTNQTNQTSMITYENETLGIAFEYPTGWEVSQWDFSEMAEDELSIEPTELRVLSNNPTPEELDKFNEILKTRMTIRILDAPEILDPNTLQLERVTVSEYCNDLRGTLSDETLETSTSFSGDEVTAYWLSNQIGRDEITTVANQTACRIDSIALHDDVQETFDIDVYLSKGDKDYSLTFSTDPKSVPTMVPIAEKMIESFRFLDE